MSSCLTVTRFIYFLELLLLTIKSLSLQQSLQNVLLLASRVNTRVLMHSSIRGTEWITVIIDKNVVATVIGESSVLASCTVNVASNSISHTK